MKTLIASAALALAFAAPAFAEKGSLVEFAQEIANASTDGQDFRVGGTSSSNPALVAFAQEIANASTDGQDFRVGGGSDVTASTRGGISAGHAKIAEGLGLNAADYTLNELVQIKSARYSDDHVN